MDFEASWTNTRWVFTRKRSRPLHPCPRIAARTFTRANRLVKGDAGASRVCWLLAIGILIFSGSLYVLAATGVRTLGAITPFGGLAFIAAWRCLRGNCFAGSDRSSATNCDPVMISALSDLTAISPSVPCGPREFVESFFSTGYITCYISRKR